MNNHLKAFLWLLSACLISASNDLLTKLSSISFSPTEIIFFRFFFSFLAITPFLAYKIISQRKKATTSIKINFTFIHILRSAIWVFAIFLWTYSASHLPLPIITIASFLTPLFTIILSRFFLSEKISLNQFLYVVLALFGIAIISNFSTFSPIHGATLILATAMFSILDIINKKMLINKESNFNLIFFSTLYSMILAFPFFAAQSSLSSIFSSFNLETTLIFILLGIGANLILYCMLKSFSLSSLSSIQYARYLEFPISCILSFIFFSHILDLRTIIGCIIIILSNILAFKATQFRKQIQ